jgi:cytochrome c oxidase subunit II
VWAPAGPQAATLFQLWIAMLAVCVLVFIAVMAALALALWRAPRASAATAPELAPPAGGEAKLRRSIAYAVAVSGVLLFGLLAASFFADRAIARLPLVDAVHIDLIAHQWWWEARYGAGDPARVFETANELHVPVGRPVLLTLRADDVIHSFWIPNLHGKKDLIPGRESTFAFRADRKGVYRGQCAEFCGYQHAHMALFVIAEEPDAYARWEAAQREPARAPQSGEERRGYELATASTCGMCHTIGGTSAQGRHAPDLTHVAARSTLAAGAVPNTPAMRELWVADPHSIKPGVNMPAHAFAKDDLAAISAYLGSLQ